jgi:hypothetical protein
MNSDQDPWDRIHDCDRDEYKPEQKFSKGEVAFWTLFVLGLIAGICAGAIKILNAWLQLPN